ncbi:MAG TPA: suppressor of fused domain protein [Steroidobacter sp.]
MPHSAADIRAHVEKYLGPIDSVLQGAASDEARIDILHVAPAETRPVHTLCTSGMSDRAMPVPPGSEAPAHIELMMTLPGDWKVHDAGEEWSWPLKQLTSLARLPQASGTWLGWGRTIANGEPPMPLAPGTKLCGAIIVPSLLVPTGFYELESAGRRIAFFSVVPLYKEELELKEREGMEALLSRLVDKNINDVIDPRRRNVGRRFGLF